jgi:hypothetical protein
MDFVRYADGKIVEHWNVIDVIGLMTQLDALPGQQFAPKVKPERPRPQR